MESFYDPCAAAELARGAAAAYGKDQDMTAWAREQGCPGCEVVRDDATDTLGFVAAAGERAFVVFRGTRDLRNWITDLDCRRVNAASALCADGRAAGSTPQPEVHEGFLRALESVWERVAEALGRMAAGKRDLFFAGHSLGGALAMLATARWEELNCQLKIDNLQFPISAWLYTFGQPRVGNGAWARWYDGRLRGRSFRVVHAQDVVARMPWLLGRFRHAGTEIFYDALGRMHQDWPWWAKAPGDAAGLWREWKRGKIALLGDHHVSTYVEMLLAECETETILPRSCPV
jgi:triacylglycerol lipase